MNSDKNYANQEHTAISIYLEEIGRTSLLSRQEEIDLARRIKRGDKSARAKMIEANLRLVVKIAHEFENRGLDLLDLVNEGNTGLMKAVERFDPNFGAKFSTYGSWWIKQAIRRAVCDQGKTIRAPVHAADKLIRLNRIVNKIRTETGIDPTNEELAEALGSTVKKVLELKTINAPLISLDAPVDEDSDKTFGEILADEDAADPSLLFQRKMNREKLFGLLDKLSARERQILILRFGLNGNDKESLEKIGGKFRITRERVRQLQATSLCKLRKMLDKIERIK